ncbi:MAG TPA: hypothetical protein VMR74_16810 [Gammaproteobacteria bacterium]|nr:hypothetical protein [Gammaproteobacteria bacterium]
MSRVHAIGAVSFAVSGLALGACAASGPEAPEPAAGGPPPVEAGQPTGSLAGLVAADDVEVVRIELIADELAGPEVRISCDLERKPGTRIVVGQTCERVGGPRPGVSFHPDDWDLKIKSPGVYEMRRRE